MGVTPILKPLRVEGGTFYTFQPAMKDLNLMFGNSNMKFNFSKFVCIKLPKWEQTSNKSLYIDPNKIESINDNSVNDTPNLFFPKAYFQNYAENLNTIFDTYRVDNNFANTSELSLLKALQSPQNPPLDLIESGTYLDFNDVERTIYKESNQDDTLIQFIGDINMINNVKANGDEYVEVYGHIPTSVGKLIDVQFIKNLDIQPTLGQIPEVSGTDYIVGQQNAYENSTDKSYCKALYDTDTRKYNVSTDKDLLKIDWNDLEKIESQYKFNNGNFEFNAVLVYYDLYDKTNQTQYSRNLYGILILDSFDLSSPISQEIKSFKKYQPNENQSGNSYGFRFNLMFSNSSNIVTSSDVINDYSTVSMELYSKALEVLTRIGANTDYLEKNMIDMKQRLDKLESLILSSYKG